MVDTYTVERKIRIDAPASVVYERIVDFHRWPTWSPYEELDPDMNRTYVGAESGVGAVYEWSGNLKAGAGRMEIVDALDDERVVIDQRNLKLFPVGEQYIVRARRLGRRHGRHVVHDGTGDAHDADHGHLQVHGPDGRSALREGPGEAQGRCRGRLTFA
jgi:Polyketide cyclase / dehydrase and lipid transport